MAALMALSALRPATAALSVRAVVSSAPVGTQHRAVKRHSIGMSTSTMSGGAGEDAGGGGSNAMTLCEHARDVLLARDVDAKRELTLRAAALWRDPSVAMRVGDGVPTAPELPGRPANVEILPARDMPRRGKGGSLRGRQAILHALVHIESVAIDLSWDIIARFPCVPGVGELPRSFFDDFVTIAEDEARHYGMLRERLRAIGNVDYGDLPAHDGLWQSALETRHDILDRLVIEHCVHEARGLDVTPQTIARLRNGGDEASATMLEEIYADEITHVTAGMRWFKWVSARRLAATGAAASSTASASAYATATTTSTTTTSATAAAVDGGGRDGGDDAPADAAADVGLEAQQRGLFADIVRKHFRGGLKPPFNHDARSAAGMSKDWYEPLVRGKEEQRGTGRQA